SPRCVFPRITCLLNILVRRDTHPGILIFLRTHQGAIEFASCFAKTWEALYSVLIFSKIAKVFLLWNGTRRYTITKIEISHSHYTGIFEKMPRARYLVKNKILIALTKQKIYGRGI